VLTERRASSPVLNYRIAGPFKKSRWSNLLVLVPACRMEWPRITESLYRAVRSWSNREARLCRLRRPSATIASELFQPEPAIRAGADRPPTIGPGTLLRRS